VINDRNAEVSASVQHEQPPTCGVHVLQYSRHPPAFHKVLLEGAQLRPCREALAKNNYDPEQRPSGAKVFVQPEYFEDVAAAAKGMDLKPFHVLASEEFVDLVEAAVHSLRSREQVREKSRSEVQVPLSSKLVCNACGAKAESRCSKCGQVFYCSRACQRSDWAQHQRACVVEGEIPVVVSRTFIHVKLESSLRSAPSSSKKTSSTTDADKRKGAHAKHEFNVHVRDVIW